MAKRKDSAKENLAAKCSLCEKVVSEKDLGIQCELCEAWFHASCSGVGDIYTFLGKCDNLHWFCNQCNKNARKTLLSLTRVEDKINKVEQEMSTLRADFDVRFGGVSKEVEALKCEKVKLGQELNKLKEVVDRELLKVTNDVKKEVDDCMTLFQQDVTNKMEDAIDKKLDFKSIQLEQMKESITQTQAKVDEQKDKEERINNIIIYRVPESQSQNASERGNDDKRFVEQLLCGLQVGIVPEDIKKVMRLGKLTDDTSRGPRPLLVYLYSRIAKNLVMEGLYKLKSMETKFRSVIIAHDMTKLERQECKSLVQEAKQRTENETGEWVHRVRGPPGKMHIVRIRIARQ